jgi:hypothetical protein
MKMWSQYDLQTGLLTGVEYAYSDANYAPKADDRYGYVDGQHRHDARRVDLETGAIVSYQPQQPSEDHEWDAASERWKPSASAVARARQHEAALSRIQQLEGRQSRAVRDAMLTGDRTRLAQIEDEITTLRKDLSP